MKKGCIIVLVVLAVLFFAMVISLFVGYRIANQRVGISLAPTIRHEEMTTGSTRMRLVIYPEMLAPHLIPFIPPDVEIPTGAVEVQQVLQHVLPREVALLVRSDVLGRKVRFNLFINEKRFGPFLRNLVNHSDFFAQTPQVNWTSDGFELPERGLLFAEGDMDIPVGVEEEIFALWPTRTQASPALILGGHHAELVIDNRDGDILALMAALVQASGQNWALLRAHEFGTMAVDVIEGIRVARLTADLMDVDTAAFDLRIDSNDDKGPAIQFLMSGLALPALRDILKNEHNLILEGDVGWLPEETAVVGKFTLTGLNDFITDAMQ